jgi:kumamolisin
VAARSAEAKEIVFDRVPLVGRKALQSWWAAAILTVGLLGLPWTASALANKTARISAAPATQQLRIILPLKADDQGLENFAAAVSTPGSPDFGAFQQVATLGSRFGASASIRQRVIRYLRAHGATNVRVDQSGLLAYATLPVSRAERVFGTPLALFAASDGSRFVAPARTASIPRALRGVIEGVLGLNTRRVVQPPAPAPPLGPLSPFTSAAAPPSSARPFSGTPSGCSQGAHSGGFTPNQYLTAYGYNPLRARGLRGQGQRMALVEIDGFKDADVKAFAACFGLDRPAYTAYAVGGLKHLLRPGPEATLDFEVANAVAPDLKRIEVFETAATDQGILSAVAAPLFTPGAKPAVISFSIGECELGYTETGDVGAVRAMNRELELMAAAGISFVASSGDEGSGGCRGLHRLAVQYPASSPWATAVGGTNFVLNSANEIQSQIVWNDSNKAPDSGGGGGFSILGSRPSYQKSVVSRDKRAVPDVAMLADIAPGYAFFCSADAQICSPGHPWQRVGGTSAGTPLLAAGLVLVDQDLSRVSRELVGFANPLLYAIGGTSLAGTVFDDVTAGTNDVGTTFGSRQPLGCCTAKTGFDEATGWGSVNLSNLDDIAKQVLPKVPKVSLSIPGHQHPVAAHRAQAVVGCSRACRVGALLEVAIHKGKTFEVNVNPFSLAAKHTRKISFRFNFNQEKALRSALAKHRPIFAEAFAYARASSGNATVLSPGRQVVIKS